jgi:hypothetical protein
MECDNAIESRLWALIEALIDQRAAVTWMSCRRATPCLLLATGSGRRLATFGRPPIGRGQRAAIVDVTESEVF